MLDLRFRPMQKLVKPHHEYRRAKLSCERVRMLDELERELGLIQARDIILEAGFKSQDIRNDGWPRGNIAPSHPQIRLYFQTPMGSSCFPCAHWDKWESNLRAIGLAMQDLRLMRDRGIGQGTEQYRGFAALPEAPASGEFATAEDAARFLLAQSGSPAFTTETVRLVATGGGELDAVFRSAMRLNHPDAGGSAEMAAKVNAARRVIEAARAGLEKP